MGKLKKLLVLVLTAVMTANLSIGVGYAAETSKPPEVDKEEPQVIAMKTLTAAQCKKCYETMDANNAWTLTISSSVASVIGSINGVASTIAQVSLVLQSMNYNMTKKEFKAGWKSGKGCKMIIYDNAVPCVLAL